MKIFGSVKAHDDVNLRVARFEPPGKPTYVVQIVHGFGEGLAHYEEIAGYFAANGYACVVHDQRGFGEMPDMTPKERKKVRGVTPGYEYLIEDIKTLRREIDVWYPGVPVILYGHSMGGNLVANLLVKCSGVSDGLPYAKAVLEAPWLRLYKPLPKLATSVARLIGKARGNLTISAKINVNDISRNRDITRNLRSDGIYHNRMSLRLYAEVVEAGEYIIKNADRISVPTLLLCPGADRIVCPKAIREFYKRCSDNVMFVEYPDAYHCLHADINNAEVIAKILEFCSE